MEPATRLLVIRKDLASFVHVPLPEKKDAASFRNKLERVESTLIQSNEENKFVV